jgi:hypothetical protein
MADEEAQLRTLNESGFPLQIAVCHLVDSRNTDSRNPWRWKVRYTEHAWRHDESGRDGFIDVVLSNP